MRIMLEWARGWAALAFLLAAATAQSQTDYELSDFSAEPKLTQMSGGDFTMEEMAVGEESMKAEGGGFSLEAAVSTIAPAVVMDDAEVFITVSGGSAVLTWMTDGGDYILESSPSVGALANWQPVNIASAEQRHTVSLQGAAQFFRLRRR